LIWLRIASGCFQKYSLPSRDEKFRILKTTEKCGDATQSYSTTGVAKKIPTVAASLD
jgi:hypothetical protein